MKYLPVAILLATLFSACIDPEQTRPYDEFVEEYRVIADAGASQDMTSLDPPADAPRDEAEPPEQCSVDGGASLNLNVVNATGTDGTLYWIDPQCELVFIAVIDDGVSQPLMTYVGHVFRFYGSGATALGEAVVAEGDTEMRFE